MTSTTTIADITYSLGEKRPGQTTRPYRITQRLIGPIGDDGKPTRGNVVELSGGRLAADGEFLCDRGKLESEWIAALREMV